ncbi:MAG TPA: class I SAM-dependent methyltransferase [Spirochaetota bacterium]|nr:class I SAM-dependent methyltransferase [Spirochaetota bacterium]
MKNREHITSRYIFSRFAEICYRMTHPAHPWLTLKANRLLSDLLRPESVGIEFGSGRSTVWFARKVTRLISVEHDKEWFDKVRALLRRGNLGNVEYFCRNAAAAPFSPQGYLSPLLKEPQNHFDFVLVDGLFRDLCAILAVKHVKVGGFIVIDNVNWYLPSASSSPNSRTSADGPASYLWGKFLDSVREWKAQWTTNGVSDTAFYFKPGKTTAL